jgi:type IV pilus assembly protein PilA
MSMNNRSKNGWQQGFTLIEVLIVIAILGVLAAIAFPMYLDFSAKAKVSEALVVADNAQKTMALYIITNHAFPAGPAEAGIELISTQYLQSMSVNDSGLISLQINPTTVGVNLTINLQASMVNNGVAWTCTSVGDVLYAPANCR